MRRSLRSPLPAFGLLSLLALSPLLSGCDDEGGLDLNGEYFAEVTGDVTSDLAGEAFYTTFDGPDGPTFVLLFFRDNLRDNDEDAYAYVALWRDGTAPGVGVYPISSVDPSPETFSGSYTDLVDAETPEASGPAISATTGVLTITDFDTGELTGSFRFDGEGLFLPETDTFIGASVSGTFVANFIDPGLIDGLSIDFDFD